MTAIGQEVQQCAAQGSNQQVCVRTEHHPSGPTVTKDWRKTNEKQAYKREILGARSGALLIDGTRLMLMPDQTWVLLQTTGTSQSLLQKGESLPKSIHGLHALGYVWDVTVIKQNRPTPAAGVATEDEAKLDLQLVRKKKSKHS